MRNRLLLSILSLSLFFGAAPSVQAATAVIDYNIKYQTIEGFGGGLSFHVYPYLHPKKEELYDSIFNKAKVNIIRLGNWYNPQLDTPTVELPMMKEIQQRWPHVKTMMTSWSPPPYLKSNNSMYGLIAADTGTLKKNANGAYMYSEYGDYWLQSAKYFINGGMKIDWLSIQNEPDWPAGHEGCVLEGRETSTIASYGKAHTAVYNKLKNGLSPMIPMIGPDVAGIYQDRVTRFITSPETNTSEMAAYCHHLYDQPDASWFANARSTITGKPIYQSEFLINEGQTSGSKTYSWMDNAFYIHHTLVTEGASMYCLFALAYKNASMHTFFSMDTLWSNWYQTRNVYYMFKQFSANISRGWKRIDAKCDDATLLISAYCDAANDSTAIVIINNNNSQKSVSLSCPGKNATVIQTSNTRKYEQLGAFGNSGTVALDPISVTTVNLKIPVESHTPPAVAAASLLPALRAELFGSGRLLVTGTAPAGSSLLSLFDCRGNRLATHTLQQKSTASVNHLFTRQLAPGRYLVTLSGAGTTLVQTVAVVY